MQYMRLERKRQTARTTGGVAAARQRLVMHATSNKQEHHARRAGAKMAADVNLNHKAHQEPSAVPGRNHILVEQEEAEKAEFLVNE
jgi:hypothetical protein